MLSNNYRIEMRRVQFAEAERTRTIYEPGRMAWSETEPFTCSLRSKRRPCISNTSTSTAVAPAISKERPTRTTESDEAVALATNPVDSELLEPGCSLDEELDSPEPFSAMAKLNCTASPLILKDSVTLSTEAHSPTEPEMTTVVPEYSTVMLPTLLKFQVWRSKEATFVIVTERIADPFSMVWFKSPSTMKDVEMLELDGFALEEETAEELDGFALEEETAEELEGFALDEDTAEEEDFPELLEDGRTGLIAMPLQRTSSTYR